MTEQEAAERLCAVLNEIEAAGHEVAADYDGDVWVGQVKVALPGDDGEPWEVRP